MENKHAIQHNNNNINFRSERFGKLNNIIFNDSDYWK